MLLLLLLIAFVTACDDAATDPDPDLAPDTAHGPGLLLPWSEVTGRITYATPTQLKVIDGVRREVRDLRNAASDELFVDLASSPDDGEVAVVSLLNDGTNRISVLDAAGAEKRRIDNATCARWLPDGRLSWLRADTLFIEAVVAAVLDPQPWSCPTWSRDGTFALVSLADTVRRSQVYRITLQNPQPQMLTMTAIGGPRTSWDDPAIAPGGNTFAVIYASDDPVTEIMLANIGGGIIRKIGEGTRLYGLSWAPDGSTLLAVSTVSSAGGLFTIRLADGAVRKLVAHPVFAASWGP